MKLLILTQKVNQDDPILGFFHQWIEEFSKHFSLVTVICLEEGKYHLPENVRILSLGKEKMVSKPGQVFRFYSCIWKERKNYDVVFVHMNPEYIVLGGWFWKLWSKRIGLWYVHRQVNLKLRIATFFSDIIFTSSKESFGLKSQKVQYLGHGIDPGKFPFATQSGEPLSLVHLGRISRIKHIETILKAGALLDCTVRLVGSPVTNGDQVYKKELMKYGERIVWDESNDDATAFVSGAVSVNAAPDGGMDKAVLGSLAAGYPTFASNHSFAEVFGEYTHLFIFEQEKAEDLVQKIRAFQDRSDRQTVVNHLSQKVRENYSIPRLIERITSSFQSLQMSGKER